MTHVAEWLDTTWAFEIGLLQPPHTSDLEAYYPHSCPICDPFRPKNLANRPKEVQSLVEFRSDRIPPGNPIVHIMNVLNTNKV